MSSVHIFIQRLTADLRYGARQLRRSPAFTIIAVLTLALGIGANTAIFSMINAILLKTLPVENPQELRHLGWTSQKAGLPTLPATPAAAPLAARI